MGEQDPTMTRQEQAMARLVRERSRRSKRNTKYTLADDDEEAILTHGGKNMTQVNTQEYVMLSDDEGGDLEAMDTELHFGGGASEAKSKRNIPSNPYGPSSAVSTDLTQLYSRRKTELDDLIARRKLIKAERLQSKEQQSEAFEAEPGCRRWRRRCGQRALTWKPAPWPPRRCGRHGPIRCPTRPRPPT